MGKHPLYYRLTLAIRSRRAALGLPNPYLCLLHAGREA